MATRRTSRSGFDRRGLKGIRARIGVLAAAFALSFLALAARVVDLQVFQHDRLGQMARDQTLREMVLTPTRGRIEDRHGEALALSVDVDSVRADPSRIDDPRGTARRLARVLDLDARPLERRLSTDRYFAWVKRRVSPEEAKAVEALGLTGIGLTREARRFYPHRELAGHLLGFAGVDGHGLAGVELTLDPALRGEDRTAQALRDARGNRLLDRELPDAAELSGGSVSLTLDRTIQWITESALAEAVLGARAQGGAAVVLDPRTGEILAAASRPTFNPNEPGQSAAAARRNRVVTDIYEPGSVFKVFTIAAALEAGAVRARDTFDCERGAARIGGHTIHDSHAYDRLDVADILRLSSNIGAAKIGRRMGKTELTEALLGFGFGARWGVELPGEQPGRVREASGLTEVDLATIAFGQGVSATALQVATAMAAVANDGVLMQPYVVREVRGARGEVLRERRAGGVRRVLRPEVARQVARMMEGVVLPGGTGPRGRVPGYRVAGKTGTSQKVDPLTRGYSEDKRVASFGGFVPADDPRLVILVVVDEPEGVKFGGVVAAPAFREIAERSLRYLGIPPARPEEIAEEEIPEPLLAAGDEAEGLLLPASLLPPPEGKTLVPDLTGLDARTAVLRLAGRHLEARIVGTGLIRTQRPAPGTIVAPGAQVEIDLAPRG